MAAEFEQMLADLRQVVDEKLGEIEEAHHGHARWLEKKGERFLQTIGKLAEMKDGVFKVPQSRKPKQGAPPVNDENAPPGQHVVVAQTPAAVKRGRGLKDQATPAPRMSTRTRQKVLRDLQPSNGVPLETPVQPAPLSVSRPSTRSSSRHPAGLLSGGPGAEVSAEKVPASATDVDAPASTTAADTPASMPVSDAARPEEGAKVRGLSPVAADGAVAIDSAKRSSNPRTEGSEDAEVKEERAGVGEAAGETETGSADKVPGAEPVLSSKWGKQTMSPVHAVEKAETVENGGSGGTEKRKGKRGAEAAVVDARVGKEVPAEVTDAPADISGTPAEGAELPQPVDGVPAESKLLSPDVSGAAADQAEEVPPVDASLSKAAAVLEESDKVTELAKETVLQAKPFSTVSSISLAVSSVLPRRFPLISGAAPAGLNEAATEKAPGGVHPGGRMTRRRAKELGVEFEALPSGLVDGSGAKKGRGRRGKKNRRQELDADAIQQRDLEGEMAAVEKLAREDGAEAVALLEADEGVGPGEEALKKVEGGDEEKIEVDGKVPSDEESDGKAKGCSSFPAVVPETPQEAPQVRRSKRGGNINEELPAGRITRARAGNGELAGKGVKKTTVAADEVREAEAAENQEEATQEALAVPPQADSTQSLEAGAMPSQDEASVPDSEDEGLAEKRKGGKKKGRGKQKKAPRGKKSLVVEENKGEPMGEKEPSPQEGSEEAPVLESRSGDIGTAGVSQVGEMERDCGAPEAIGGPVSSLAETWAPAPEATAPSTGPLEIAATSGEKQSTLLSPCRKTPSPNQASPKPRNASQLKAESSAFGSPVPTAPELALRGNQLSTPCSPGGCPWAPSNGPASPPAVDPQPTDRRSPSPVTKSAAAARCAPRSASQSAEKLVQLTHSPLEERQRRVTRSTTSPVQNVVLPTPVAPVPTPVGLAKPSPLAVTAEAPGRITRSASRARSISDQPSTPLPQHADIAPDSSTTKESRERGDVIEQPTPACELDRAASSSAQTRTPSAAGVLTRSQSKQRGVADVSPSRTASPEILLGDLSEVLGSSEPSSAGKLGDHNLPFESSPQPEATDSPVLGVARTGSKSPNLQQTSPKVAPVPSEVQRNGSGTAVPFGSQDASPTVDMDVSTTPLSAGLRKAPRPMTGKRNAQGKRKTSAELAGSEGAGVMSAAGQEDVRTPPRRSPRLQGVGMTSAVRETGDEKAAPAASASAPKSRPLRSAKKMRVSGGFELAGCELIDLENEDEDLMEPNFAVNSEGLRRSTRKTGDATPKGLRKDGGEEGKNRLSFSAAAGISGDVGIASPGAQGAASGARTEQNGFRFSAHKLAKKSARKGSAGGRPSFVSASDDGSGEFAAAGFTGLTAEASAGGADGLTVGSKSAQKKTPAKRSNLISNGLSSLLTFVMRKEPTGPPIPGNNKNTVKGSVKALEAAEAARREEAKKVEEREKRKALLEKRREEKLREAAAGAAQANGPPAKSADPGPERRVVPGAAAVSATVVDQKLRRANEFRSKIEEEKARRLEEDLRKKDEERRKKETDAARRKRAREEEEKRDRDEKRRRMEDAQRAKKEMEERQRAEIDEKDRKRKQQEEAERKQKVADEEERRRRRKEKELEAERRRKEEDEKRVAKLKEREEDRKRQEGLFIRRKEDERNEKLLRPNGLKPLTPIKTYLADNAASARHSPLMGTDKIMPPPKTTPSRHAHIDAAVQNQYAPPTLSANSANPAFGYASSSLATKPSGLALSKPAANPPSNLRLTGWEKPKPTVPGQSLAAVQNDSTPHFGKGKGGGNLALGGGDQLLSRAKTPPPTEPVESYEISPFKEESSDEEEDENESEAKKPIPAWARKENLGPALRRQMGIDPDEVFQNLSVKTCSLDQVFGTKGSKKKKDFGRRSSSGNWLEDRLTWKEELQYKKGMGYL